MSERAILGRLRLQKSLLVLSLIPACVTSPQLTDSSDPSAAFRSWPDFAELQVAVWKVVRRAGTPINRGDALLIAENSSVTVRSTQPLVTLAGLVGEKPDRGKYLYDIRGPAFVRFDDEHGVGFNEGGLVVGEVTGSVALFADGDALRQFVTEKGFFSSNLLDTQRSPDDLRELIDRLPWKPGFTGMTITAWAAIRTGGDSTCTLRIRLAGAPSPDGTVSTVEEPIVIQVEPLTTLLLTPFDRREATILDQQGKVEVAEDEQAVWALFAETRLGMFREYAP